MSEFKQVNLRLPRGLADALTRECSFCGCSVNAVITRAVVAEVKRMASNRRTLVRLLPGQLEISEKG